MMNTAQSILSRAHPGRLWLELVLAGACCLQAAAAATPTFMADCQILTRANHRLTGTPESAAAAAYLERRLHAIGLDQVMVQTFPSMRLTVLQCTLTIETPEGKRALPLQPMRPNGIIPPVTPEAGLRGEIIYAGSGTLANYGARSPRDKIVVLDYNSDTGWLRAFRMGACAVIFVSNSPAQSRQCHYLEAPANFPRYYYAGDRKDLTEGSSAVIHSAITWDHATGRNVIAFLNGADPRLSLDQNEAVVLAAPMDSYGEVPFLSPGARGAANCAALLTIAEFFVQHPPRRDTVLVFFDGQAYAHAGVSAFYRALKYPQKPESELGFLESLAACLQDEGAFQTANSAVVEELIHRLKIKMSEHVNQINIAMEDLRTAMYSPAAGKKDRAPDNLAPIKKQLADYQALKDHWNNLRRALNHRRFDVARQPPLADLMKTAFTEVQADIDIRNKELTERINAAKAEEWLRERLGNSWISLHSSLLLGDGGTHWGLVIGGNSTLHAVGDQVGLYVKLQNAFEKAADVIATRGVPLEHFDRTTASPMGDPRLFWAGPLVHSGEIAGRLGIYNLAFGTGQDPLFREGTPDDTLSLLRADLIETQALEIARLLVETAGSDGLSLRRSIVPNAGYFLPEVDDNGKIRGPILMGTSQDSSIPGTPMPHGVVMLRLPNNGPADSPFQPSRIPAFNNFPMTMTDANASYGFGPVLYDPGKTLIQGFAVKLNDRGEVLAASTKESTVMVQTRLNLVSCSSTLTEDGRVVLSPRYGAAVMAPMLALQPVKVMRAITSSLFNDTQSYSATQDDIVFWYGNKWLEAVKLFGLHALVALHNSPEQAGAGTRNVADTAGLSLQTSAWHYPSTAMRSIADLWHLNERRLESLRSKGVMNSSMEELHGRAEDLWIAAGRSLSVMTREALALSAFFVECPIYLSLRRSLSDLVKAVLVLLALAVPFAYALERLLIGAVNIYRQIAWFCLFFTMTFLFLYAVHPAFAVSAQPMIIFLAFALILLSSMVILLMMQKFDQELKMLQGFTSTVHAADVSRFSTMIAAVNMGISTMRRRPLRTGLTALTITLLTFTILNFASFSNKLSVVKLFKGSLVSYPGVFMHQVNWAPLNPGIMDIITGHWGKSAIVTTRHWQNKTLLERTDNAKSTLIHGVLGMDAQEISARPDLQQIFGAAAHALTNGIFMTETLAKFIGVTPGDSVILGGIRLRVAGLLNAAALTGAADMDGSSILPVDLTVMDSTQPLQIDEQKMPGEDLLAACENDKEWVVLPADGVVIVSTETARQMGGILRAVTLYPPETESASRIAEAMASVFPLPVAATLPHGVYTHVLTTIIKAQGVKNLFFPLLLGGLVIFGTLLGSVADREREIYTFSALGLAPPHVATLFVAEAMVYSCIGGVGGYLFAQGLLKLLTTLQSFGIGTAPEMNYSSLNAITTIVIVMSIVLLSAIYPAFKASRSANPGVLRTWRLPPPDGDRFHIVFPFTVSQYDITGVISFLKEHFDNFSDTSLGVFMAKDTTMKSTGASLELHALLALAPFDLGVTEEFQLRSVPSEIPGIDEVEIQLLRKSGQRNDWVRMNKHLLNDLRRQFLIWRSLPQDTMELYRHRTLMALGQTQIPDAPAPAGRGEILT